MKVMVILGTRPEAIKLAPVIKELQNNRIETLVCTTGQHREMLMQVLDVFDIKPNLALDVMSPDQSLNQLPSVLLAALDDVLIKELPDWVLVQGDTTTAFCAGLAAFHRKILIGHIEAGLRTYDLASPFPEEANRILLSRIASIHFAPTITARQALEREGIAHRKIFVSGNTIVDAIEMMQPLLTEKISNSALSKILGKLNGRPFILVTCHRRENFGDVLENICTMLKRLCEKYADYQWIFPVHLNPKVQDPVNRMLSNIQNLNLLPPLDYLTNLSLIKQATLIISDSGGIQEEAPSFGVPVVVMRNHTERMEGVRQGFATLAGQDPLVIEAAVCKWLDGDAQSRVILEKTNPYGDGLASKRIRNYLQGIIQAEFNG